MTCGDGAHLKMAGDGLAQIRAPRDAQMVKLRLGDVGSGDVGDGDVVVMLVAVIVMVLECMCVCVCGIDQ